MRAPLRLTKLTSQQRKRIKEIRRESHVRAFGEELARVNLDLTEAERVAYLGWMRRLAAQHGVKPGVNAEWEWMSKIEEQLDEEERQKEEWRKIREEQEKKRKEKEVRLIRGRKANTYESGVAYRSNCASKERSA